MQYRITPYWGPLCERLPKNYRRHCSTTDRVQRRRICIGYDNGLLNNGRRPRGRQRLAIVCRHNNNVSFFFCIRDAFIRLFYFVSRMPASDDNGHIVVKPYRVDTSAAVGRVSSIRVSSKAVFRRGTADGSHALPARFPTDIFTDDGAARTANTAVPRGRTNVLVSNSRNVRKHFPSRIQKNARVYRLWKRTAHHRTSSYNAIYFFRPGGPDRRL